MGLLSLKRLTGEGLDGRASLLKTLGYKWKAVVGAALFLGARLGNLEWACLPGTLRDS
jgi:hypothetical protein